MPNNANDPVYLSERDIARRYGVHQKTPWYWLKSSDFPEPVRLGPRCTRWRLEDLQAWEARRAGGAA